MFIKMRSYSNSVAKVLSLSFVCAAPFSVQATDWVSIEGKVQIADGTPICAMVLANGQYMFSCDGTGAFGLNVPLDDEGQVTLFSFADGFAPFRITQDPSGFPYTVEMETATAVSGEESIVGLWKEYDPYEPDSDEFRILAFLSDGTYSNSVQWPCGDAEHTMEVGTYSYDAEKKSLEITSVVVDGNGECGLANFGIPYSVDGVKIWRDGDYLIMEGSDGITTRFPRFQ